MLPKIDIKFTNGNIGNVTTIEDGIFGLISSAAAVASTFALETPYVVKSMKDVAELGIAQGGDNEKLYKTLAEFYVEAGEGTELWIMGFAKSEKVSDWFTPDGVTGVVPVENLLNAANGKITAVITSFFPATEPTVTGDMDPDVAVTITKAQAFAESYTENKYAPLLVLTEAYAFSGTTLTLTDIKGSSNRVGVFIGDTAKDSKGTAIGILAGRLAKSQVHVNPGKVKDGATTAQEAYIKDKSVEQFKVEDLHNKGYITFRTHVRKSGYYISDDPLATATADDFNSITRRRVIDKAFRLAHNVATNELLADFDVNNDGTISPFYAKTVEGNIEREIFTLMTANGELSRDAANKDDLGVEAKFDTTINVAQTSKVQLTLKVRPKGYARDFEILLGYDVTLNN